MITPQDIKMLNENETVEFKSTFQSDAIETLVAFANTKGGGFMVSLSYSEQKTSLMDKKQVTEQVTEQVTKLILLIEQEMTRVELMAALRLTHRQTFLYSYLKPAVDLQLIEMTIPDKVNSNKQKYRLTEKGKVLKNKLSV